MFRERPHPRRLPLGGAPVGGVGDVVGVGGVGTGRQRGHRKLRRPTPRAATAFHVRVAQSTCDSTRAAPQPAPSGHRRPSAAVLLVVIPPPSMVEATESTRESTKAIPQACSGSGRRRRRWRQRQPRRLPPDGAPTGGLAEGGGAEGCGAIMAVAATDRPVHVHFCCTRCYQARSGIFITTAVGIDSDGACGPDDIPI